MQEVGPSKTQTSTLLIGIARQPVIAAVGLHHLRGLTSSEPHSQTGKTPHQRDLGHSLPPLPHKLARIPQLFLAYVAAPEGGP